MKKRRFLLSTMLALVFMLALGVASASATDYTSDLCTDSSKAYASASYSGRVAARAFDNANTSYTVDSWEGPKNSLPQWLGYDFSQGKIIQKYTISQPGNLASNGPKSWVFQGSNDNSSWTNLHSVTDAPAWAKGEKREYTFNNSNGYQYYRIYMSALNAGTGYPLIGEAEMMEEATPVPVAPTDLTATPGDAQASLSWTAVAEATGYNVKRATTTGGPYETVADSVYEATYVDTGLTNGITYYYVVSATTASGESGNSNEVSVTPQQGTTPSTGNGTLIVTVENNADREYNLTMTQIQAFIDWYNNRSTGGNVYTIEKPASGAYTRIKDYLIFDKIVAWEVKEY